MQRKFLMGCGIWDTRLGCGLKIHTSHFRLLTIKHLLADLIDSNETRVWKITIIENRINFDGTLNSLWKIIFKT